MDETEIVTRLAVAMAAGLVLGFDREVRGKDAGLRTNAMVALSSCIVMVSGMLLYDQVNAAEDGDVDPLRIVQGIAQAIGFIAAGMIFVSRGNVLNLTSAANVWFAAALGMAAGLGQYLLVGVSVIFGLIVLTGIRFVEDWNR